MDHHGLRAISSRYYREGAVRGGANAQVNLARMYLTGTGVHRNEDEGLRWMRRAAEQGLPAAQTSLGSAYQTGDGVVQDYAEALHWYESAARQGDAQAAASVRALKPLVKQRRRALPEPGRHEAHAFLAPPSERVVAMVHDDQEQSLPWTPTN